MTLEEAWYLNCTMIWITFNPYRLDAILPDNNTFSTITPDIS